MTTEELNAQLCQKLGTEQAQYRAHLPALPPADILKSAYSATINSIGLIVQARLGKSSAAKLYEAVRKKIQQGR